MAEQTTNLGLTKPDAAEGYDINVFNNNADIIDGAVGTVLNEIGTTGSGGMSDKVTQTLNDVNTLQDGLTAARLEIAAVKTDTAALVQALATANANIATLLTQSKSVKQIYTEYATTVSGGLKIAIPSNMDKSKIVVNISGISGEYPVSWRFDENDIIFSGANGHKFSFQLIEFY